MRVVIAPDKFKGCLDAQSVCSAIAAGWKRADPHAEPDLCPMADGGEGIVAALVAATGGRMIIRRVTGPLPEMKVDAAFGMLGDGRTAVVEIAAACGLALLKPEDRDPMATTSFGAGELICGAIDAGAKHIIVGLGGSATIDCGIGIAQACGLTVLLAGGELVSPTEPLTGADLEKVIFIKHGRGGKVDRITLSAACDVNNPLCGPNGAAAIFGPQKGATPEQVMWFDRTLARLAERTGHQQLALAPGAGAAGGLGFALLAYFGASLKPGIEIVIEAVKLEERLRGADLCITGEGRLDAQSFMGKTVGGVAGLCRKMGVKCVAIAGSVEATDGLVAAYAISDGDISIEESMVRAAELIADTAESLARREFKSGSGC